MKFDIKKQGTNIVTFLVLAIFAGSAMAAIDGSINKSTSKLLVLLRSIFGGLAVISIGVESFRMAILKQRVMKELMMILGGIVLFWSAAELYAYVQSGSTGGI